MRSRKSWIESDSGFTVNKDGNVRFGLGGIKGFGDNIVKAILADRDTNGPFSDIYDFTERMAGTVNRKAFESLLYSGAFDSFGFPRSQYLMPCASGDTFLDALVRYADLYRRDTVDAANSLFGEMEEARPVKPEMPPMRGEENELEILKKEKELVGMYLSSHPLDKYSFELENFTSNSVAEIPDLINSCESEKKTMKICVAGYISSTQTLSTKTGKPYSKTVIEDKEGSYELALFGKDHENFMSYMQVNSAIFIEGEIGEKYFRKPEDRKTQGDPPYGFKIKKIMLLGNVTDSYIKGFSLNITTPMLNSDFREKLGKVIKKNKGTVPLTMFLYDPKTRYKIEFLSRKFQVAVTAPFISELKDLDIRYSVIKK